MHRVLVLDANQRSALAIIRSLGQHGLRPIAADAQPRAIGAASRFATAFVRYPDPAVYPDAFVNEISAVVSRMGIDTIVPATDLTTMLLVSQSNLPQSVKLVGPGARSYEALTDKADLLQLAKGLEVLTPETRIAHSTADIQDAIDEFGVPAVLKPARSRYMKGNRVVATSVQTVRSRDQLQGTLDRLDWLGDIPCLVQRFIPGRGAGIFALYSETGPVAWFAHKRIREKPPTGGVSVLCESVPIDPLMQTAAMKLLSAVGWVGVAMVEFRVTDDGKPYLMEVNGRFWGSLQLAIDCGIDFPWLLYRVVHGLPVDAPAPYAHGRRLRWLLGDLDSLGLELRRTSSRSKASAVGAFLRSFLDPLCRQETFRVSDPSPGIREAFQWIKELRR